MKKIKKALILAAGKGTRLHPLSASTPKPLLEVKGTSIIENIIHILISKGIEEIYIVVGYRRDKFKYLKSKYKEVKLIYNNQYEYANTASAIYVARKYLDDNFIIIDGDLYMTNRHIIHNKIEKSMYLYSPMELQNEDWGFKLDPLTNNVLEVRKPEETVYLNNKLFGISYWLKEDLMILVKEITYNYKKKAYSNLTYDEIINEVIDKITLGVEEVNTKYIFKMKELEDLYEVDASYTTYKGVDLLCKVLDIKKKDITDIYDSPGRSLNNINYVVEVGKEKYLLRIPGKGTELFNDRTAERDAYEQLKHDDLVEECLFIDPLSGIKISKFYDGSRIINSDDENELKQLMTKLKQLHNGHFKFNDDDVFDRIRRYDSFVASVGGRKHYSKEFIKIQKEILNKELHMKDLFTNQPIHSDLSPNNVLVTKDQRLVLIDLEFISMGDPFTDLANFAHDGMYSSVAAINLLEIYLDRPASIVEKYKMLVLCAAVSVMWYSWAVYKMAVEEKDFQLYKSYRDQYLKWAVEMKGSANSYSSLDERN